MLVEALIVGFWAFLKSVGGFLLAFFTWTRLTKED